ncbi:hypothetical protein PTSG_08241 [Salpingoeca rosetta]|uniref:Thioredoxin domain-containing protein n=1 Tax=Salpingoeca rosetta (strain ATCC 50818 / BSB-021) TaxID=946362 RepID=F2UIE7_SALR5|nr:uncharacterized protein PTSG_08241 [Salpingoeca rosetta]EGD76896.1 hypothetical protein PTSG_08241 [Salpingoeca rosetta]|eukprot:XP_004991267.1 hypothetical protein PTSG_08241 [Salpingoeca rosetta]
MFQALFGSSGGSGDGRAVLVNGDCLTLRAGTRRFTPRIKNTSAQPWSGTIRLVSVNGFPVRGEDDGGKKNTWQIPVTMPGETSTIEILLDPMFGTVKLQFEVEDADGQPLGNFQGTPGQMMVRMEGHKMRAMALMLHKINGRDVFDTNQPSPDLKEQLQATETKVRVTPALVRAMLQRESELRKTDAVQREYTVDGVIPVTQRLQRRVAEEFGFSDPAVGVELMQAAEALYPDEDMRSASHWRKYNRASRGVVSPGDDMTEDFAGKAEFMSVYLCEAHAQDEWPVGDRFINVPVFDQHKTVEERATAAGKFVHDYGWHIPMYLDTLDNAVVTAFGAWPLRFFIVQGGKLVHKAEPTHEYTYSVQDLRDALTSLLSP